VKEEAKEDAKDQDEEKKEIEFNIDNE